MSDERDAYRDAWQDAKDRGDTQRAQEIEQQWKQVRR